MNLNNIDSKIINWDIALQQANGKEELAANMLRMLIKSLPRHKVIMDTAYQEKELDAFYHEVHKLHGALCYCGTPRLKKAAKELEHELQDKQDISTDKLYKQLKIEIDAVIKAYKKMEPEEK